MPLPGRQANLGSYRYGFQNQETDPEMLGGAVAFTYRVHDARIGRFLSVDPLNKKYPFWSPYVFSGNQIINRIELEGLEPAGGSENENESTSDVPTQISTYGLEGNTQGGYYLENYTHFNDQEVLGMTGMDDFDKLNAIINGYAQIVKPYLKLIPDPGVPIPEELEKIKSVYDELKEIMNMEQRTIEENGEKLEEKMMSTLKKAFPGSGLYTAYKLIDAPLEAEAAEYENIVRNNQMMNAREESAKGVTPDLVELVQKHKPILIIYSNKALFDDGFLTDIAIHNDDNIPVINSEEAAYYNIDATHAYLGIFVNSKIYIIDEIQNF